MSFLSIRVNRVDYKFFKSAEVIRSIENAASTFSFEATAKKTSPDDFPIREWDKVEIFADGEVLLLTGYVEEYSINYSANNHTITVKGRSLTADLIDSAVLGAKRVFEPGSTFLSICETIAKDFKIDIEDLSDGLANVKIEEGASVEKGNSAFNFLLTLAKKHLLLLTDNEKGNLVITQASTEVSIHQLKNVLNNKNNNIKSANKRVNTSKLYSEYKFKGQLNPSVLDDVVTAKDISSQSGTAQDDDVKRTRILETYSKKESEGGSLTDQAKWEMGIRKAHSFNYHCVVQGFTSLGFDSLFTSFGAVLLWMSNKLYRITDGFSEMDGEYLCKRATYSYSLQNGSTTKLEFTLKNAYTLQSKKDTVTSKSSSSTLDTVQ